MVVCGCGCSLGLCHEVVIMKPEEAMIARYGRMRRRTLWLGSVCAYGVISGGS